MAPQYDSGFDEDGADDQVSTIREAGNKPGADEDKTEYAPVVAPKSAFMGRDLEVGEIVPMRVEAVHDDEYVLVCDESGEEEPGEPEEGTPSEGAGPPTTDFD